MKEFIPDTKLQDQTSAEINHYIEQLKQKLGSDFTVDIKNQLIDGVESTEKDKIYFRSKFLHDFQTISQFTQCRIDS